MRLDIDAVAVVVDVVVVDAAWRCNSFLAERQDECGLNFNGIAVFLRYTVIYGNISETSVIMQSKSKGNYTLIQLSQLPDKE